MVIKTLKESLDKFYEDTGLNPEDKISISQLQMISRKIKVNIKAWSTVNNSTEKITLVLPGDNHSAHYKTINLLFDKQHCAWIHNINKFMCIIYM